MPESTGSCNPFARRQAHSPNAILTYKILTPLSWLLVVLFGVYYSLQKPVDVPDEGGETVWNQIDANPTPFSQNTVVTGIFWIVLLLSQLGYIGHLWSSNAATVTAAANVAPYFVLNNLFVFSFVLLWVRGYFWGAEVIDIANLLSQGTAYWLLPDLPLGIHLPALAGPYAWTWTTLFWNGAVAVGGNDTSNRIAANIFIWVLYLFGQGHIAHRRDYAYGYSISLLSFSLSLKQLEIKIISLQWIFSFIIFGLFLVSSINSNLTRHYNRTFYLRSLAEPEPADREREPLLGNE